MLVLGIIFVALGITLLWVAAGPFVVAASRLAHQWGMSPVLIGALIIGFGTSAPELLVSGLSAARGDLAESVGNIVGSNAANLSLVLGVSALLAPVTGQIWIIKREGVITLAAMAAVVVVAWDDALERIEGYTLIGAMAVAALLLIVWSRRDVAKGALEIDVDGIEDGESYSIRHELFVALLSVIGVVLGAWLLVQGGKEIAEVYGLAGGFVGATIFALGTSLPELVTAIAAARRGANELVIGNLLGSNLFNSLLVIGAAASIGPGVIAERRISEHFYMLGIGVLVGVFAITRNRLARTEGLLLLTAFAGFIILVAQAATI
jgi:cation:H+ antiporter